MIACPVTPHTFLVGDWSGDDKLLRQRQCVGNEYFPVGIVDQGVHSENICWTSCLLISFGCNYGFFFMISVHKSVPRIYPELIISLCFHTEEFYSNCGLIAQFQVSLFCLQFCRIVASRLICLSLFSVFLEHKHSSREEVILCCPFSSHVTTKWTNHTTLNAVLEQKKNHTHLKQTPPEIGVLECSWSKCPEFS